ncbi:MAG: glycoside hydrolase family 38 C-terminal domain-containing protein, partial [Thermoproteota archaeon]
LQIGKKVLEDSLKSISSMIDTSDSELNVVVFNGLSWDRTDLVNVELELPEGWMWIRLLDPEGREIPLQVIERGEKDGRTYLKVMFIAEGIPSLGYKTYKVVPAEGERYGTIAVKVSEEEMENDFFKIKVSKSTGYIESIFDKENCFEVISEDGKGNTLQLIEDLGDSEGRLIPGVDRSNRFSGYTWSIDSKPMIEISEKGPVRAKLTIKRVFHNSSYVQEMAIYPSIRRIDFNLVIDWHELHRALKVAFPLNVTNSVLTAGIQYGNATRKANGEEQPFQQWIDMSEADGVFGVALLCNSKYSYDVEHNVLRLTLLRSPTEPAYNTDEGMHDVKYSLYPHKGDWRSSEVVQKGYEFNHPLVALVEKQHKGVLPKVSSFLRIEPKNAIVTCVKKAEDGQSLIIRLYECAGVSSEIEITLNLNKVVKEAYKTNILEDEILEEIKTNGNKLKFSIKPYEIVTIKTFLSNF